MNDTKILALITARGGSKGVPRKNIRKLLGRPLMSYSIAAALECRDLFHRVVVSTEDAEISDVAISLGADVPFVRPPEFASDTASSLSVVQHAAREIERLDGVKLDWVLLIQPTNPLVIAMDIRGVIAESQTPGATSAVSVCAAPECHPLKMKIIKDGRLKSYVDGAPEIIRRQDLKPEIYKRNGSLYMTRRDILDQDDLYGSYIVPYIMPQERSIDIDTEMDLRLAELMLTDKLGQEGQGGCIGATANSRVTER